MPTVMIGGKKHTPGSNTLKRMKKQAQLDAMAKSKAKPAVTTKTKAVAVAKTPKVDKKAPVPANMSVSTRMKRQTAGVATGAYGKNGYKTGGGF